MKIDIEQVLVRQLYIFLVCSLVLDHSLVEISVSHLRQIQQQNTGVHTWTNNSGGGLMLIVSRLIVKQPMLYDMHIAQSLEIFVIKYVTDIYGKARPLLLWRGETITSHGKAITIESCN